MKRLLIPSAGLWLLAAAPAHALIDINTNGLSDLWEKAFNANALFSAANPDHDPAADPDGDDWTNLQEATAGTNPFDAQNGQGMLTPAVAHTPAIREPAPPGADIELLAEPIPEDDPSGATTSYTLEIRRPARFTLTWPTIAGKAYRIDHSTNLTAWTPASRFFMGQGNHLTYTAEALHTDNTEPEEIFYRVVIEDADSDGDSFSDWEEGVLGTDAFSTDTDRDGIADNLDQQPLVNALQTTWDADANDPTGATLFAAFHFTPPASGGYPITAERVTDISGNSLHGKARTQSGGLPSLQNPPQANAEGISNSGFHCANTHHFAFEQKNPGINFAPVSSLSFWLKTESADLTGGGQPIFSYSPRTAAFAQIGNTSNPYAARAFIRKQATGTGYEVVWLDWTYPGNIIRERWTLDLTAAQIDQRWLNLTFVWQGTGSGQGAFWACYANGSRQTRTLGSTYRFQTSAATPNSPQDTFVVGADAAGGPGHNNLATIQSTFKGTMDRIRFHSTALNQAQVEAIVRQDTDRDGLWDSTEASATAWRDGNGNGKRDPGEILFPNGSPVLWQPADTDSDGDGLTDLVEQSIGTRIDRTDTDGDRLPDGWEVRFTLNPLDTTGANGQNGDPDGDGFVNLDEYRYNSKPKPLPGDPAAGQPGSAWDSDGDGTNDNPEFLQGSHAGNADDGGLPLPTAERVSVKLGIGDESASKSEDYSMEVFRINPESGKEELFYTLHSGGFGEFEEKTLGIFRQGQTYTYRIVWNATSKPSSEGPDLDYTFRVQPQGTHTGFLIDGYDIRRGIANLAEKLIGEDLQNVAADEQGFREKFQDRRVVLMGVSTLSADRMFGASMQVLPGLEDIQLQITNTVTGENFGTHSQLFAKAYTDLREMYGAGDNFGKNIADPRVWFIQRYTGGNPSIQAYLTGDPSLAHGSIRIQATLRGNTLGSVRKTLTPDADFAALIATTSEISKGPVFATGGGAAAPPPPPFPPHRLSTPLRIPCLMLNQFGQQFSLLFTGLGNGIGTGLKDDWIFLRLVIDSGYNASGWSYLTAKKMFDDYKADPYTYTRQYIDAYYNFFRDQICIPASAHAGLAFASPGDFIDTLWNSGVRAKNAYTATRALVAHGVWKSATEGIAAWFEDLTGRMFEATEKHTWSKLSFPLGSLAGEFDERERVFIYSTGYCMGYMCEQLAVGAATVGVVPLAKVLVINGAKLSGKLAARSLAVVATRSTILKRRLAGDVSNLLADGMEQAIVVAARTPLPEAGGKVLPEVIEDAMKGLRTAPPAPAIPTGPTWNELVDDLISRPNLIPVLEHPVARHEIFKATALAHQYLAGPGAETALRNWPKFLNAFAPNGASGIAGDYLRYSDIFTALKADTPAGKQVLIDLLESIDTKTASELVLNGIPMPGSIKNLYPKMYHYADFDTMKFFATDNAGQVVGKWRLDPHPSVRYVTPELINTQALAKSKSQLPLKIVDGVTVAEPTKGRFRFEATTSNVAGEYIIPRANVHSGAPNAGQKDWVEILVKDNPLRGSGGATQFVEKEARTGTLFDTVTQQYVRDKTHLQEILNTNP